MTKGVITHYGTRFVDYIAWLADRLHLIKCHSVCPITNTATGNEVGGFYCVTGWKPIVKFLEWATDDRGKNCQKVVIKW